MEASLDRVTLTRRNPSGVLTVVSGIPVSFGDQKFIITCFGNNEYDMKVSVDGRSLTVKHLCSLPEFGISVYSSRNALTHCQLCQVGIDSIQQLDNSLVLEYNFIMSRILPDLPVIIDRTPNLQRYPSPLVVNGMCVGIAIMKKHGTNHSLVLPNVLLNKLLHPLITRNEVPRLTGVVMSANFASFELENSKVPEEGYGLVVVKSPKTYNVEDGPEKVDFEGKVITDINGIPIDGTGLFYHPGLGCRLPFDTYAMIETIAHRFVGIGFMDSDERKMFRRVKGIEFEDAYSVRVGDPKQSYHWQGVTFSELSENAIRSNISEDDPNYDQFRRLANDGNRQVYVQGISHCAQDGLNPIKEIFNIKFPILIRKIGKWIVKDLQTLINAINSVRERQQRTVTLTFVVDEVDIRCRLTLD